MSNGIPCEECYEVPAVYDVGWRRVCFDCFDSEPSGAVKGMIYTAVPSLAVYALIFWLVWWLA